MWKYILPLLLATPLWAATVVHHTGSATATSSTDVAVTITSTVSNLIVVGTTRNGSTDSVASVTDNIGNVYVQAPSARGTSSSVTSDIWYCAGATSGVTTVTIHWGITATSGRFAEVWEIGGFIHPILDYANHSGNSGVANVVTGATAFTSTTAGFIAAIYLNANSSVDQNPNSGNAFTSGGDILSTSGGNQVGAVSLLSSSISSFNPAWHTTTATPNGVNSVAAFKEGATSSRRPLSF